MRKKFIFTLIFFLTILVQTIFADEINQLVAQVVTFKVVVNQEDVSFNNDIVTINDKTYIPLRDVSEILDNNVEWDNDTKTISIDSNADKKDLFPFQSGTLYGYIDKYGKIIIEPQFEYAGEFSEGLACVGKSKDRDWGASGLSPMTYGYINTTGKLVIPYINERERDFHNGLAAAWEYDSNDNAYFINKNGENILNKYYYDVKDFSEGYAAVLLNNTAKNPHRKLETEPQQWTFINTNGEECGEVYNSITSFVGGVSIVEKNGKIYAINTSFEPIFYSGYTLLSYNGNNRYIAKNPDTDKYGVIDDKDNIILDFNYDYIHFSDNMYKIGIGDYAYGLANKYGEIIVEPKHNQFVTDFIGGMAVVGQNNSVINRKGEVVLEASEYDKVTPCANNLIYVYKKENDKNYEGYIDKYGNVLIMNEIVL